MKQLWPGGPVYTDDPSFKITTDSVLLAHFSSGNIFARCADLGCGGGLLSVLLHHPSAASGASHLSLPVYICVRKYTIDAISTSWISQ